VVAVVPIEGRSLWRARTLQCVLMALVTCAIWLASAAAADASSTTFSGIGGNNTSVTAGTANAALNAFEAGIGGTNNGVSGPRASGFRTINWDGVPDAFADPNALPAAYYNANSPRGLVLATPGSGVEVSGSSPPNLGFGDLNLTYPTDFPAFSPARIFSPIGSNVTDISFYAAGTGTHATVHGFGAIFRNVEAPNTTSGIEYFDQAGHSLGKSLALTGAKGEPEFLGVLFSPETVARVEITSGTTALGPNDNPPSTNVVALDDFAYSEPQALPSPTLTVSSPTDGATVNQAQLTVSGTVSDPVGVVALTVNGSSVAVAADGLWSTPLTLSPGSTAIAVLATDVYGNSAQVVRAVSYTPPSTTTAGAQAAATQSTGGSSSGVVILAAVSGETLAPAAFSAAPSGPSALPAKKRYGTQVSYVQNETASVRFSVVQRQPGRKAGGGSCATPTTANRHAPRCTRRVTLPGGFTLTGSAGANRFRFAGRLGRHKLSVGKYELVATPSAGGKIGHAVSAPFQIIK